MLRQSSSRSHRSRKLGPSHSFQAFLFIAVGIWIVYQLTHYSYGKRRVAPVEADGEPVRRRLGRRGFVVVDSAAGHASADLADDPLSNGDGDGYEDQEADEDDGGVDDGVADADDSLAADEEDYRDFQAQNSSSSEDKAKARNNGYSLRPVNGTDTVQDGVAVLLLNNATENDGAADGTAPALSGSALKNSSSVDLSSLQATVGAPGAENKKPTNNLVFARQNRNQQINNNGTADSVAGHGISS